MWCKNGVSFVSAVSLLLRFTLYQSVFSFLLSVAYPGILLAMMYCKNDIFFVSDIFLLFRFTIYQSAFALLLFGPYRGIFLVNMCCKNDVSSVSPIFRFLIYESVWSVSLIFFQPWCVKKKRIPCIRQIPPFHIHFTSIRLFYFAVANEYCNFAGHCVLKKGVSIVSSFLNFTIQQSVFALLLYGAYPRILLATMCL